MSREVVYGTLTISGTVMVRVSEVCSVSMPGADAEH
jgi:hypothetical protein